MKTQFATRFSLLLLLPLMFLVACGEVEPPPAPAEPGTPAASSPVAEPPTPLGEQPSPVAEPPTPLPEATPGEEVVADEARQAAVTLAVLHSVQSRDFHGLAGDLAAASEINPRWLSLATNTFTVVGAAAWADDLTPAVDEVLGALKALTDALETEDLGAALAAAEATHDAEHDLIEAGYEWLSHAVPPDAADADLATLAVLAAIGVVDDVGYHDLAHDVAKASEANPLWTRSAERTLIALSVAPWPPALASEADSFAANVQAFLDALAAGDLAAAGRVAEALHDGQHDLSEAAYSWLAASHPLMRHEDAQLAFGCLLRAVDAVDALDFHDMARDLAQSTEVDPRIVAGLGSLLAVLNFEREDGSMATMAAAVAELRQALERGDLAAAQDHAEAAHDAQHDFTEHAFESMSSMPGH